MPTLEEFFRAHPKAALAFSGGTDSALLLWAGKRYGCDIRAYYVKTAFQPEFEYRDALRLARELDVPMTVVEVDILSLPGAAANGPERCYFCKKALFSRLREAARKDGYALLLDGTNASDDAGDRPGMRAIRELEVRSPLHLGQAGLRLSGHPHPHRHGHHSRRAAKGGEGGDRPPRPGLPGLPGAAVPRPGPGPGAGGADGSGPGTAGGNSGRPGGVRRGGFGFKGQRSVRKKLF